MLQNQLQLHYNCHLDIVQATVVHSKFGPFLYSIFKFDQTLKVVLFYVVQIKGKKCQNRHFCSGNIQDVPKK